MFLIKIVLVIILNAGAFWAFDTKIFPDSFSISGGLEGYAIIATIFTILNMTIGPILRFIALPFHLLTLGIIGFVINGLLLFLLEHSVNFLQLLGTQMEISSLSTYLFAGAILSILNSILHVLRG